MPKPIFCLMGPTASGKTALACQLIKAFPLEIISVDSALIYREMNIGTAKLSPEELKQAPHHLIDIIDPPESYSAAEFCKDVACLSQTIYSRGNVPLLVGGTMMYFQALQQGLSSLPQADEALRLALLQRAEQQGWAYLHQQLAEIDKLAASKIHPHDTQRIQRALEVYYLTGKPLSFHWQEQKSNPPYHFINLILLPEQRAWLHKRIALRFEQMLEQGFVSEVEQLMQKWQLSMTCPALRSVGYRQIADYLKGAYGYEELKQKAIAATRQLAKRQLTWLRHWQNANTFVCEKHETASEIMVIIEEILDNKAQNYSDSAGETDV